jgi:hypothetical protein
MIFRRTLLRNNGRLGVEVSADTALCIQHLFTQV